MKWYYSIKHFISTHEKYARLNINKVRKSSKKILFAFPREEKKT